MHPDLSRLVGLSLLHRQTVSKHAPSGAFFVPAYHQAYQKTIACTPSKRAVCLSNQVGSLTQFPPPQTPLRFAYP